jgi:hypothetical protein
MKCKWNSFIDSFIESRQSSISIVTWVRGLDCRMRVRFPVEEDNFLFATTPRLILRSTEPAAYWVQGYFNRAGAYSPHIRFRGNKCLKLYRHSRHHYHICDTLFLTTSNILSGSMGVTIDGFGLLNIFIYHLYAPLGTTFCTSLAHTD